MSLFLVNHLDKKGSSFIEIMAMMAILSIAVAAMFSTVTGGIFFAKDSENRIKAINLAREGIEGVTSLRNTNWLRFSSDQMNCWKIQNYSGSCIGDTTASGYSIGGTIEKAYTLENRNGAWYLTGTSAGSGLWVNAQGSYVTSGSTAGDIRCNLSITTNCRSAFTREVRIRSDATSSGIIYIKSIVDWSERQPENVTLESTLTNWKSKF